MRIQFLVALILSACGTAQDFDTGAANENELEFRDVSASPMADPKDTTSSVLPQGLNCGLMYWRGGSGGSVESTSCNGYLTKSYSAISNYSRTSSGDYGLSSGQGYYTMARTSSYGSTDPSKMKVPKGTVCGLGHSKNYPTATCMGYGSIASCPSGWNRRIGYDASSSGGYWHWCEYQDPSSLCTSSSCYGSNTYVPQGTVCGLGHNDWSYGSCTTKTISSSTSCPSGYTFYGWYDRGSSSGHGMGWCQKN